MNNSNRNPAPHGNIADHVKEKARFAHLRTTARGGSRDMFGFPNPSPSPGATIAFMDEGDNYYAGVAYCNPADNFSKATGRIKATGRLVQTVLGTADEDEQGTLYFSSNKDMAGDFKTFKRSVIADVASIGDYNVLPGPKEKK